MTTLQDDTKYAIGRNPYPENSNNNIRVLNGEKLPKELRKLNSSPFRSDQEKKLRELEGFKHLAWTPRIRHLYYNLEKEIMVKDVEGDFFVWKNPIKKTIEKQVQEWPKAEVSLGEKYDSRFNRQ
jgi:hypothetical protein